MEKQLKQLKEFHEVFNLDWGDKPAHLNEKTKKLRIEIMREEMKEATEAMENEPIENIAKELADVLYVVCGTIGEYGLGDKMEQIFDEVHKSNMSKLDSKGKPIYREDGKVLKSSDYKPADIKTILQN